MATYQYYQIDSRTESMIPFTVRATGYQHAARIAARRLHGHTGGFDPHPTGHQHVRCNNVVRANMERA